TRSLTIAGRSSPNASSNGRTAGPIVSKLSTCSNAPVSPSRLSTAATSASLSPRNPWRWFLSPERSLLDFDHFALRVEVDDVADGLTLLLDGVEDDVTAVGGALIADTVDASAGDVALLHAGHE